MGTLSRPPTGDLLLIVVGVLGVSTSGPLIAALAVPPLAIAFWRNAFGTTALVPYALARHCGELRDLRGRRLWLTLAAGVLLAAHFALWVPSLSFTSVASSTALVCMQAVWAALFGRLVGHVLPHAGWFGMLLALVGVLLVTGVDFSVSRRALVGDVRPARWGSSGAYVVLGTSDPRSVSTTAYTLVCYGSCAVLLLVACLVAGQPLTGYAVRDWLLLLVLTVLAQLLGHSVFNLVLRSTSPTVVSLAILFEVPGAALLAAWWLGQTPPLAALPALVLMLAGIAIVIRAGTRDTGDVVVAQ